MKSLITEIEEEKSRRLATEDDSSNSVAGDRTTSVESSPTTTTEDQFVAQGVSSQLFVNIQFDESAVASWAEEQETSVDETLSFLSTVLSIPESRIKTFNFEHSCLSFIIVTPLASELNIQKTLESKKTAKYFSGLGLTISFVVCGANQPSVVAPQNLSSLRMIPKPTESSAADTTTQVTPLLFLLAGSMNVCVFVFV